MYTRAIQAESAPLVLQDLRSSKSDTPDLIVANRGTCRSGRCAHLKCIYVDEAWLHICAMQ